MPFRLTHCFANPCDSSGTVTPISGFALITLRSPYDVESVHHTVSGISYPVNGSWVVEAAIDPATGCWETGCDLPCNNELFPEGSYFEVQEFIGNEACGEPEFAQTDCANNVYPNPVPLPQVSITNPQLSALNPLNNLLLQTIGLGVLPGEGIRIDLAGNGLAATPWELTPVFELDTATGGNLLTVGPNGLLASLLVDPGIPTDTADINISGTGAPGDPLQISVDVRVDNVAPGNGLVDGPDGLFVDVRNNWTITPTSPGVDLNFAPAAVAGGTNVLDIGLAISNGNDNQVVENADGLFVPGYHVVGGAGLGISNTDTGTGTILDPVVITPELLINPAGTADVTMTAAGLLINDPVFAETNLAVTVNGAATAVVQGGTAQHTVDIRTFATDAGQLLSIGGNGGLFLDCAAVLSCVPAETALSVTVNNSLAGVTLTGAAGHTANITTLAADAANILSVAPDGGLYLDAADVNAVVNETPLVVNMNGATLGVTQAGTAFHNVDFLTLSGDANQLLSIGSDGGLYIDSATISANLTADVFLTGSNFDAGTNTLTLDLTDGNSFSVDFSGLATTTNLQATDSTSIDFTLVGDGSTGTPFDVTGAVIPDPNGGIQVGAAGVSVFVDPASTATVSSSATGLRIDETGLVITTDTNATGVTSGGVNGHTVDIRLLSASGPNSLALAADGGLIFDPTLLDLGNVDILDSPRIDLGVTGTGTAADPRVITADIIPSPDGDNTFTNAANGAKAVSYERLNWSTPIFGAAIAPLGDYVYAPGNITAGAITAGTAPDGPESWELRLNGVLQSTGTLPAGATSATFPAADFPIAVAQGDIVTCVPVGPVPATPSTYTTASARLTGGI